MQEFNQIPQQQIMMPMPPKKKNTKMIVVIILAVVAAIALVAGGGSGFYYVSGNIDGTYRSSEDEKAIKDGIKDALSDYEDVFDGSKLYTNIKMENKVVDDHVTLTLSYTVDTDEAYSEYKSYLEKTKDTYGLSDEDMKDIEMSKSEVKDELDDAMDDEADNTGLHYDSETGKVSGVILEGDVKRWSRTIEITKINDDFKSDSKLLKNIKVGDRLDYKKTSDGISMGSKDYEKD